VQVSLVEATGKLFRDTKSIAAADYDRRGDKDRLVAERAGRQPLLSLEYLVSSLSIFDVAVEHDTIYALLAIAKDTTPSASDQELTPEPSLEPAPPIRKPYHKSSELLLDRTKIRTRRFHAAEALHRRVRIRHTSTSVKPSSNFVLGSPTLLAHWTSSAVPGQQKTKRAPHEKRAAYENSRRQMPQEVDMLLPTWVPTSGRGAVCHVRTCWRTHSQDGEKERRHARWTARRHCSATTTPPKHEGSTRKTLRFKKRLNGNMHFSMYVKGFVLDTVEQVYPASQGGAIPQEWIDAVGWRDVDKIRSSRRVLAYSRSRSWTRWPESSSLLLSRACKESFLKGGLPSGSVSTSGSDQQ
jgi:hypothetical protein